MVKSKPLMEKSKKTFNHLKIHTQYSICEGAIKIDELSKYCKENKIKAIGMSDTSNLCGSLEFSEQISNSKTQPIIGSQIKFKFNDIIGSLPIIAKNRDGYKELINLSSKSFLENSEINDPHCKIELLFNYSNNLIILSGGINNLSGVLFQKGRVDELEKLYFSLNKNFGDNFYIEIQRHGDLNEKNFESLHFYRNFNVLATKKLAEDASKYGVKRFINNIPRNPHLGLDIAASNGTPVYAAESGLIVLARDFFYRGNNILIDHGFDFKTSYSHLAEILVNEGDLVKRGELIGFMGATGRVTGPHLHFEVIFIGEKLNPEVFLTKD